MRTYMCPVCHAKVKTQPIATVTSTQSTDHFVRTSSATDESRLRMEIEKLWGSTECQIFNCNSCESRFANPHIAGSSEFYRLAFPDSQYPSYRWEFDMTKKPTFSSIENRELLLEIGAGSGSFIKQLLAEGVEPSQIVATEFSNLGTEALKILGVSVQNVDFRDGVSGAPFRVIVLFQTLEHLDRLDEVLQSLAGLGTSNAELFISVPNATYINWQEKNLNLIDMPPNHITAFSALGLRRMLLRNGWTVVRIEFEPKKPLLNRCKDNLSHIFAYPTNRLQIFITRMVRLDKRRFRRLRIVFWGSILCISNFNWIKSIPSESIWIHAKQVREK